MSLLATLERFRIRTHFTRVLLKLRCADTSHLSSTQKKNREKQIQVLEAYAKRGEYPKNTNHPGQRVPYFRDEYGTLCAVGYLMWHSGEHNLVESIVASDNYVRVIDISEGPAIEWMEQNGLTQEECAEIQPTYNYNAINISAIPTPLQNAEALIPIASNLFLILGLIMLLSSKYLSNIVSEKKDIFIGITSFILGNTFFLFLEISPIFTIIISGLLVLFGIFIMRLMRIMRLKGIHRPGFIGILFFLGFFTSIVGYGYSAIILTGCTIFINYFFIRKKNLGEDLDTISRVILTFGFIFLIISFGTTYYEDGIINFIAYRTAIAATYYPIGFLNIFIVPIYIIAFVIILDKCLQILSKIFPRKTILTPQ